MSVNSGADKEEKFPDLLWDRRPTPEYLWHYTDGNGILGIANSRSLWCTEYRHLNDRQEIYTFASRFQSCLQAELKDKLSPDDIDKIVSAFGLYQTWPVFVCSFCADADRNEHWHQYLEKLGMRSALIQQSFAL